MEVSDIQNLKYRRQYLITPVEIDCPFSHKKFILNSNYILYVHMDLVTSEVRNNENRIFLLGDIFDFRIPEKDNRSILNDLIGLDFISLSKKLSDYTGRYLLIFQNDHELKLIHDAIALRKIYYAQIRDLVWFASQPYLLARILNLKETKIPSKIAYYNAHDYMELYSPNIGNITIFDEIFQVLPNHYFDAGNSKVIRYWPGEKMQPIDIEEAAERCASIIKGYMKSITARYNVMLPVTAGKDSRLLLAATKDLTDKVFYYINKDYDMDLRNNDIRIPQKLLPKLGLKFHLVNPYIPINEDFKRIYFENHYRAVTRYLPIIHNYYQNFSGKINLPAIMAFYPENQNKFKKFQITPLLLAKINEVSQYDFAIDYYTEWLSKNLEMCKNNNIDIINLYFWEDRCANYITQVTQEKDVAQDDIFPYNSRLLVSLFLSVGYKLSLRPKYLFFKKIIKKLWPEVLQEPMNPSPRAHFKYFLNSLGFMDIYNRIKMGKLK
ncbi:MAG: hypothetical protein JXB19_09545 [Bacteroidales bacterium]|nr:hypothetical protein [Bacteroidales bacterium]